MALVIGLKNMGDVRVELSESKNLLINRSKESITVTLKKDNNEVLVNDSPNLKARVKLNRKYV